MDDLRRPCTIETHGEIVPIPAPKRGACVGCVLQNRSTSCGLTIADGHGVVYMGENVCRFVIWVKRTPENLAKYAAWVMSDKQE